MGWPIKNDSLRIRKRNLRTFDEVAVEYGQSRRLPWLECVLPLVSLGDNSWIIDAGAGTGRQTLALAHDGLNVIAIDFSSSMLGILKEEIGRRGLDSKVSSIRADLVELPLREGRCDGAEVVAAIHNIPTGRLRVVAMKEISRCLRRGGRLVLTTWYRDQRGFYGQLLKSVLRVLLRSRDWGDVWLPWRGRPRFYHLFSRGEAQCLVRQSDFDVETLDVRSLGPKTSRNLGRNIFIVARKL